MLDFFKTAAGSMNYVLIGGVLAWIASTWVIVANLHKHRTDTITAQEATHRAEKEKHAEENRRREAEARLAKAEEEIAGLRPKPFRERAILTLRSINPGILESMAKGETTVHLYISSRQFVALQDLVEDPEAPKRIWIVQMLPGDLGGNPFPDGIAYNLIVGFDPNYFKTPSEQDVHGNGP